MADIKLQAYQGTEDRADRRGDLNLGKDTDPVDRHMTLLEYRIPDEFAAAAITELDVVNDSLAGAMESLSDLATDNGFDLAEKLLAARLDGEGPIRLGFRVYDND